jgi:hypothetical protein
VNRLPSCSPLTLYLLPVPHASASPNVLAVRFSSIGDILLTTPLLRAIRRSHTGARLTVLTKREFVPLLSHNPNVHRVIGLPPGGSLRRLAVELRADGYTHLLDLHDNLRSRALRLLVPGRWRTYPKHRLARWLLIHRKRNRYRDRFEKEHGVRLGFMSFFVKAAVGALKRYPVLNASIDGNDGIYHGYFDIGIAVASPRGLVVPIIRNADQLSIAEIEKTIADFGKRAQDGKLGIEELTGGTFSISNGGVFGSMLSTPIINPPQSAILGVHATKDRAVVENGQVVVRPMNYLALSYDHRIIDGREAVLFLVAIKDALEDPARLILEI